MSLDLPFPRSILDDPGKKTERVTFTATDDLATMLRMLTKRFGVTTSEYCCASVIERVQRDVGLILTAQAKANKQLKDLLR